ncbi:MAG TPA: hypothetical protein VK163_00885 [Opitutaceae bacterium]|nr:hypothetical protein [Opitutaceae bacterium]
MADDVASTFGPMPGATLTATPETLRLKGNRGDFLLSRAAVVSISRGGFYPWFFKGIRIRHRLPRFPRNLQFLDLSGSTRELLAALSSLGFPVR